MSTDPLERLERPEYIGENRCWPCTVGNLLIAAVVAALVGRRNRALGIVVLLGSVAVISLRGYLVPGTPRLTERYLPESVLVAFGKVDPPEPVSPDVAARAADRATDSSAVGTGTESTPDDARTASNGATPDDPDETDDLLERPMDELLESFDVVEADGADLELVDAFRERWERKIDRIVDDRAAQGELCAAVFGAPAAEGRIERRDDGRYEGFVDDQRRYDWISDAAMCSDLAAHRVLSEREEWDELTPRERLTILRGFRVFLTTCPLCEGPIDATDDVVDSCCGSWDVLAIECTECGTRFLELTPPDEQGAPSRSGSSRTRNLVR